MRELTAEASGSSRGLGVVVALGLLAAVVVAYWPAIHGGYIWDDDLHVTQNIKLHDLAGLRDIWLSPGAADQHFQFYPLVHTTFWIEYQLWQLKPLGYHLTNVLLHGLCAVLVWRILRKLAVPGALLVAALFALHPVHVESVAWISERKNVLSGLFYLASMLAYLRFARIELRLAPAQNSWAMYALSVALFAAALLSKTVTCSLPAALLLILWWKRDRLTRRDVLPLIPMFALGVGMGLVTIWLERERVGAVGSENDLSLIERVLIAGRALWFYAGKLVWPSELIFIYPKWTVDPALWWQWLSVLGIPAAAAGLWLARRWVGRGPLVAVFFFAGTLFPALGFINVYPMRYTYVADHYQYLASLGVLALLGAAAGWSWRRSAGVQRGVVAVLATLILAGLAIRAWNQTVMYESAESLWTRTLDRDPRCWMAHNNLGLLLAQSRRVDQAEVHFRRALEIKPDHAGAANNLGVLLESTGRVEQAIESYRSALRMDPNFADAHNSLGVALLRQGRIEEGLASLAEAVRLAPHAVAMRRNYALVLGRLQRWPEAAAQFELVLRDDPDQVDALNNLALIRGTHPDATLRDGAAAVRMAERACALTQFRQAPLVGILAAAYAEVGRFDDAVQTAERALQLATQADQAAQVEDLKKKLLLYRAGRRAHENLPPAPAP